MKYIILTTSCSQHRSPQASGMVHSGTGQMAPPAFQGTVDELAWGSPLLAGASLRAPEQWPGSAAPAEAWGTPSSSPDTDGTLLSPSVQPVADFQGRPG